MRKTPEQLPPGVTQGRMFEEEERTAPPTYPISPPHMPLVEEFKKSREKLLTPTREPDIHERFQEIQAQRMHEPLSSRPSVENQGISGIATITTPQKETALAEKIEQEAGLVGGVIPVLSAYPKKIK